MSVVNPDNDFTFYLQLVCRRMGVDYSDNTTALRDCINKLQTHYGVTLNVTNKVSSDKWNGKAYWDGSLVGVQIPPQKDVSSPYIEWVQLNLVELALENVQPDR